MDDILMSADEARRKTREHDKELLKNNLDIINKVIDRACHRGDSYAVISDNFINDKIAGILRESGYSIEYNQMDDDYRISWYKEDSAGMDSLKTRKAPEERKKMIYEMSNFPTPHNTPEEPCSDYGFEGGGF